MTFPDSANAITAYPCSIAWASGHFIVHVDFWVGDDAIDGGASVRGVIVVVVRTYVGRGGFGWEGFGDAGRVGGGGSIRRFRRGSRRRRGDHENGWIWRAVAGLRWRGCEGC